MHYNFVFLDRFLFELSCKNTHTHKHENTHTHTHTNTKTHTHTHTHRERETPTGNKFSGETVGLLVFTLKSLKILLKFDHRYPVGPYLKFWNSPILRIKIQLSRGPVLQVGNL